MINEKYYAFKVIPKYNLDKIGRLNSLINEPIILKRLKNESNFVPNIVSFFQDYENIYIITTFYDGPSLSKLAHKTLSEEQIKFISACIIISFKYIRRQKIIHRDLTLSNIIMDKDHYFNLIDFSFSVDYSQRNYEFLKCNFDKTDTPPEILNNSEYNYNSDYYRLGYIIFFLVFKQFPWEVKQKKNMTQLDMEYNLQKKYSVNLFNFIRELMKINIKERLGYKSIFELINHPWFSGFNWEKLEKKEITSPLIDIKVKRNNIFCEKFIKTRDMIEKYIKLTKFNSSRKIIKFFDF